MSQPFPMSLIEKAEHVTDGEGWCWCQPRKEDVLPFGWVVVHRHFWDRAEYSEDEIGPRRCGHE